jgi:hypothetical protein
MGNVNMKLPVETDEDQPRPVTKDPFDWPRRKDGGGWLYMGQFPKRVPDAFSHEGALWDSDGKAVLPDGAPNLRNRSAQP